MTERPVFDPPLDKGIEPMVLALREAGVDTFESCEGGAGHCSPDPFVKFHGNQAEGYRALAAALNARLLVRDIQRVWDVVEGEPCGPYWQMTFFRRASNP